MEKSRKNLVWQVFIDPLPKDSDNWLYTPLQKHLAVLSSATAQAYCLKHGVAYYREANSKYYYNGYHGGPAMERFQLLEERYDIYDQILYLDTDILLKTTAPNLFEEYPDAHIAGVNELYGTDKELLERKDGWLSKAVDHERYRKNYVNGGILLMSREFRQYCRKNLRVEDINVDKGKRPRESKWPYFDQSMLSFVIAQSEFDLTPLPTEDYFRGHRYAYHYVGGKEYQVRDRLVRHMRIVQLLAHRWWDEFNPCFSLDYYAKRCDSRGFTHVFKNWVENSRLLKRLLRR